MPPHRKPRKTVCPICLHKERHLIEKLRIAGASADHLAEKFGVSRVSVFRHMAGHMPPDIKAQMLADVPLSELVTKAADESMALLDYLKIVRNTVMNAMLAAASVNDHANTATTAKRAMEVLREVGRLTGEMLNAAPIHNYVQNNNITLGEPMMIRLETMLLDRLRPYPDALQAVLTGLRALDEQKVPMIDVTPRGAAHVR